MNKTLMAFIVLVVLGAGGYLIMKGGSGYSLNKAATVAGTTPTSSVRAAESTGAVKSFAVTGSEFAFAPDTFSVNKGDKVRVVFTNNGKFPHNFTITELNVQGNTVSPGGSDTVTFTADKAGTFTYFCSVPTHKDKGMAGTFIVK
jgi:nitrite reductase (NO-forming)